MNLFRQEALDVLSRHPGLEPEKIDALLERPPKSELGDFAFPCFQRAKELKKAPPQIAGELAEKVAGELEQRLSEAIDGFIATFETDVEVTEAVPDDMPNEGWDAMDAQADPSLEDA